MYADMVSEKAEPTVLQLYPEGYAIWQDDRAHIQLYTNALMLSKQWGQASDPELIQLSRRKR